MTKPRLMGLTAPHPSNRIWLVVWTWNLVSALRGVRRTPVQNKCYSRLKSRESGLRWSCKLQRMPAACSVRAHRDTWP
ncbi:hypothetical protein BDM02DRAFT_399424 [Thelephora ganbajun]|uniref:Uncharacterized protein n=1 Tax=Thelephora ganbajun TaxID=370292 RepID=A0ACB6Z872_THEGA|nr:hypothetical protein BDM02DRAFT_399424 [Thelephora ganbajun]